jgi:hypothetical protein
MILQGFGVGDGYIDYEYIAGSLVYYEYHHGMIGDEYALLFSFYFHVEKKMANGLIRREWDEMRTECCNGSSYRCDFANCQDGKYVGWWYNSIILTLTDCTLLSSLVWGADLQVMCTTYQHHAKQRNGEETAR